jgi:plasmid stabilization system protein ParE
VKLKIAPAAARDLDEAADWYRRTALDPRVAVRFLLSIHAAFESLVASPHTFPEVRPGVRRCRVLAFPAYSVFFRVAGEEVIVVAVFHGKRQPEVLKKRR